MSYSHHCRVAVTGYAPSKIDLSSRNWRFGYLDNKPESFETLLVVADDMVLIDVVKMLRSQFLVSDIIPQDEVYRLKNAVADSYCGALLALSSLATLALSAALMVAWTHRSPGTQVRV